MNECSVAVGCVQLVAVCCSRIVSEERIVVILRKRRIMYRCKYTVSAIPLRRNHISGIQKNTLRHFSGLLNCASPNSKYRPTVSDDSTLVISESESVWKEAVLV
jgi:hypothetical protein